MRFYTAVNLQNYYLSLDPTIIAHRFNMLWVTSKKSSNLDDVGYYDIASDGTHMGPKRNLKYDLFGNNSIDLENALDGVWVISFKENIYGARLYDRNRAGRVQITTGNKALEELGDGESWTIEFLGEEVSEEGEEREEGNDYYRQVTTSTSSLTPDTYLKFSHYTITRTGYNNIINPNHQWEIKCRSLAYPGINKADRDDPDKFMPANWNATFTLTWKMFDKEKNTKGLAQDYDTVMNSLYELSGSASGNPVNMATKVEFWKTMNNLVMKPYCDPSLRFRGKEMMKLDKASYADGAPLNSIKDEDITVEITHGNKDLAADYEENDYTDMKIDETCYNNAILIYKNKRYSLKDL